MFRYPSLSAIQFSIWKEHYKNHRSICISVILLCVLFQFSVSKTDLAYKAIDIRVNHYNISEANKIEYSLNFTYQKYIVVVWNTAKDQQQHTKHQSRFKVNDMIFVTVVGLTSYLNVRTPTHTSDYHSFSFFNHTQFSSTFCIARIAHSYHFIILFDASRENDISMRN